MVYTKALPRITKLQRLAEQSEPFPKTVKSIVRIAIKQNFNKALIDFLRQFPSDEVFETKNDFIQRCEVVEMMIRYERNAPDEKLRSPQD